jgi:hypothetical protein
LCNKVKSKVLATHIEIRLIMEKLRLHRESFEIETLVKYFWYQP